MPIYDFHCKSCDYITEMMRKMSDSNVTTCPQCKQEAFEKMLSAPSFQLSGTGWYATDFKNKTTTPKEQDTAEKPAVTSCAPGCACH